jgi:hypothetical protein
MLKDFVDTFDRYKESIRTVLAKQGLLATDITEMKEASRNIINRLDVPSSNEERRAKGYLKEHQDADVLHVSNFIYHMNIHPLRFRMNYRAPRTCKS